MGVLETTDLNIQLKVKQKPKQYLYIKDGRDELIKIQTDLISVRVPRQFLFPLGYY